MICGQYREQPILEVIFEARAEGALRNELRKDEAYQRKEKEVERIVENVEKIGLDQTQWRVVDEALSMCNNQESEYARVAYELGFKDGIKLAMEILTDIQI